MPRAMIDEVPNKIYEQILSWKESSLEFLIAGDQAEPNTSFMCITRDLDF